MAKKDFIERYKKEETEEDKTVFNGGIDLLIRLNRLCILLAETTIKREDERFRPIIKRNFQLLVAFHKDLKPLMSDKERKKHDTYKAALIKFYFQTLNNIDRKKKVDLALVYGAFDEWEDELRAFQSKKGLLMPEKEKFEDDDYDL